MQNIGISAPQFIQHSAEHGNDIVKIIPVIRVGIRLASKFRLVGQLFVTSILVIKIGWTDLNSHGNHPHPPPQVCFWAQPLTQTSSTLLPLVFETNASRLVLSIIQPPSSSVPSNMPRLTCIRTFKGWYSMFLQQLKLAFSFHN